MPQQIFESFDLERFFFYLNGCRSRGRTSDIRLNPPSLHYGGQAVRLRIGMAAGAGVEPATS